MMDCWTGIAEEIYHNMMLKKQKHCDCFMHAGTHEPRMVLSNQDKLTKTVVKSKFVCGYLFLPGSSVCCDDGLYRWQLSKTMKGDTDDDIAKYDGLLLFSCFANIHLMCANKIAI